MFHIVFHYIVECIRNMFHHNIEINFILFVTICVKVMLQLNTIWMLQHFQNLQFSILIPFILEHFLDSDNLTLFVSFWYFVNDHLVSFINNAKWPFSYDFIGLVDLNFSRPNYLVMSSVCIGWTDWSTASDFWASCVIFIHLSLLWIFEFY